MRSPQEDCLLRSKQETPYAPPLGLEMGANSQWYRRAGVCQTGGEICVRGRGRGGNGLVVVGQDELDRPGARRAGWSWLVSVV